MLNSNPRLPEIEFFVADGGPILISADDLLAKTLRDQSISGNGKAIVVGADGYKCYLCVCNGIIIIVLVKRQNSSRPERELL